MIFLYLQKCLTSGNVNAEENAKKTKSHRKEEKNSKITQQRRLPDGHPLF